MSNRTQHRRPPELEPDLATAMLDFAKCAAAGTMPSRFYFQEPSLRDCAGFFADEVVCAATGNSERCRSVALRHRHAFDPFALPWQPKPTYVSALATQRRLPYQIEAERRTGVRVAVPSVPWSSAGAPSAPGDGDRGRGKPPPPPSSGVSLQVSSIDAFPALRNMRFPLAAL